MTNYIIIEGVCVLLDLDRIRIYRRAMPSTGIIINRESEEVCNIFFCCCFLILYFFLVLEDFKRSLQSTGVVVFFSFFFSAVSFCHGFLSFAFIIPLKGAKLFGSPVFKSKVSHSTFGGEVGGKATKLRSFEFFSYFDEM